MFSIPSRMWPSEENRTRADSWHFPVEDLFQLLDLFGCQPFSLHETRQERGKFAIEKPAEKRAGRFMLTFSGAHPWTKQVFPSFSFKLDSAFADQPAEEGMDGLWLPV